MRYFIFNGKYCKEGTPVIGADNRGLRYGDGIFETLKTMGTKILFADEHFARLWKGMDMLQFEAPKHFTPARLEKEIQELLEKNGHVKQARVRLTVIRGDGGLYDPVSHHPQYIVQSWPLNDDNGRLNENGLVIGIYEAANKSCDTFSQLKHNNYLPYSMAALYARQQQWNDAVILNTYGRVCDSTIANIFIVKDNIVYTPPLSEGCVSGITRKLLINTLRQHDIAIVEKPIEPVELIGADEFFLTNAIYNMRWVRSLGDKVFSNTLTSEIYRLQAQTIC